MVVTTPTITPHTTMSGVNLDEQVRLWSTNSEREQIENYSTLYGLIVSLQYLERAYVRDSVSSKE